MVYRPICLACAALALLAATALSQHPTARSAWTLDPRLTPALAPMASASRHTPVREFWGTTSRGRHAVVSVLAGAMVGTVFGIIEIRNVRRGCDVPDVPENVSICSVRESSERPILIGALLGATVGALYHISRAREGAGGS